MSRTRPGFVVRHDLGVLVIALAILGGGAALHRTISAPRFVAFTQQGLHIERPAGWLVTPIPNRRVSPLLQSTPSFGLDPGIPEAAVESGKLHSSFVAPTDARRRIELRVEERPIYGNLRGALAVERLERFGEMHWVRTSGNAAIHRRDWLRTEYRYAFKATKMGSPQIAEAVEYAIVNDGRLYVVTLHDRPGQLDELDAMIAPSLRVSSARNPSAGNMESSP